ncbi:GNAT family acetyltransferase [Sphingomonas lacunae]|uniref:GNAT family acetyltransferase n=1 Tax=Sphingomonas lacunae TaxID=2698828 RepID=A0A6M4AV51_9SPHN|nr:GNAT family acetyltransferase [Sphingomonas lacunae]QJQ32290.1 GNAT family acetyltransferase [Sphingomonas lacunae]
MQPEIEMATAADATDVIALWHSCGLTRPWNDPQADFDLALTTPTSTILTARNPMAIVGTVMVGFDGHRGWVYYLAVDPSLRRSGLGRHLMAAAEAWLRRAGSPKIQLMVRGDNQAAVGFYQALGYQIQDVLTIGRRLDGGNN